jgi:hypothetical protein
MNGADILLALFVIIGLGVFEWQSARAADRIFHRDGDSTRKVDEKVGL